MEKSTAHYKLAQVRVLITERRVRFTETATWGFRQMGLTRREALEVIASMQSADLYKSMTTYRDHKLWQDVYHPSTPYGAAYIKLMVLDGLLVVSFKVR